MHIAFLTPEYSRDKKPDGGLANYLQKIGQELVHRGHSVSILCLSNSNRIWNERGVDIYEVKRFTFSYRFGRLKSIYPFLNVISQYYSARRIEKAFWDVHRNKPVDIIQSSSYKSPAITLNNNKYVPVVCRVSSYAPLIRSAEGRQRSFADYLCDWLEIRQVLDAQSAFAPSQLMSDTYARLEGRRPHLIRTPIETTEIQLDDSCYKKDLFGKSYLLYFGTLKQVKGVDLLADVVTPVLEKYPDLYFAFVGRDDGLNSGQKIFQYICSRNMILADRLIYHPALSKACLYPIIAGALGVVLPSRMDNYPNSCLEAMFLGVPVVGTYQSSLEEMIVEGKTGFLAHNSDPESICFAIERLLSMTAEQKAQMKLNIEDTIRSYLTEDRVGQLIQFYQETIGSFHLHGIDS
jgi:glycosyltransferase involved in cell wall biosynthesis